MNGSDDDFGHGIKALEKADVASDIEGAIRRGDRRLIAIYGYALEVPGANDYNGKLPAGYEVVPIKGTSDMPRTEQQEHFQALARKYAERYNRALLERIIR